MVALLCVAFLCVAVLSYALRLNNLGRAPPALRRLARCCGGARRGGDGGEEAHDEDTPMRVVKVALGPSPARRAAEEEPEPPTYRELAG